MMSRFPQFFEESNGRLSSKRLAGLTAAWTLDAALFAHVLACIVTRGDLNETLVITVGMVALGGLGLSTVEKHLKEKEETRRVSVAMHAAQEG